MRRILLIQLLCWCCLTASWAVGSSGIFQWSVELTGYISSETGKAPNAYLWIPEGCRRVKAVIFAQQNMAEEMLFHSEAFRQHMSQLDVAIVWVAPAFTNSWDTASGCQNTFDEMMTALAFQSGHQEIDSIPVIPFGHSAQATMPWNFAAWNPQRTLCILSFHGDAPRTNLCGYGTANIEWGRTRNIDGIPGLMIMGEYEWWEARARPALAFRMMYPESCISFLCDTGHGHFECCKETALYMALFIEKAMQCRIQADGTLHKLNPVDGWLAARWSDSKKRPKPAPYYLYKGDSHDAFWYFDEEMATLTEQRYAKERGKQKQYVGFEVDGQFVTNDPRRHGGMVLDWHPEADSPQTMRIKAVYTDSTRTGPARQHSSRHATISVISGPAQVLNDSTIRIVPYECGMDNPRRSYTVWLVATGEGDEKYKSSVQPIELRLPK